MKSIFEKRNEIHSFVLKCNNRKILLFMREQILEVSFHHLSSVLNASHLRKIVVNSLLYFYGLRKPNL